MFFWNLKKYEKYVFSNTDQNADCSLWKKIIVPFVIIFGTLSFPTEPLDAWLKSRWCELIFIRQLTTSISSRWLTRATELCCRQSLMITYDKVQRSSVGARRHCQLRWRSSLSRSERPPSLGEIDMTFRRSTHRGESPEFGTRFQNEVGHSCFRRYPNFLKTQCRGGRKKLPCEKPARFVQPFRRNSDSQRTVRHGHRVTGSAGLRWVLLMLQH